ncbi:MAG: SH3 domain-containing protein [Verrucomicrobiia bacterium]
MKKILFIITATAFCGLQFLFGQEQGVITRDRVNVRGQPSVFSEVLTQLNKGDKITILEPVKIEKPKEGDLADWYKIKLPPNVAVWVNSAYINTNFYTVIPNRLNLRAGPGEQYSVLGRLEKGASVKVIKTSGQWFQIEPPDVAYAFIATEFVQKQTALEKPLVPEKVEEAKPVAQPVEEKPAEAKPVEKPTEEKPAMEKEEKQMPQKPEGEPKPAEGEKPVGATAQPEKPVVNLEERPLIKQEADAKERVLALIQGKTPAPPEPVIEPGSITVKSAPSVPPRIVTREGYVRGTLNIQAPSSFVLQTIDTGKTINYLYTTSTNISLKQFKGKRVLVTGKEAIDKRWPNTPVLTIDTIKEVEEESNANQ